MAEILIDHKFEDLAFMAIQKENVDIEGKISLLLKCDSYWPRSEQNKAMKEKWYEEAFTILKNNKSGMMNMFSRKSKISSRDEFIKKLKNSKISNLEEKCNIEFK